MRLPFSSQLGVIRPAALITQDLSGLVQQLGMVNRTDELSLLPVLSDKETLQQHGSGVFAILLQPLSANLQRADGNRI
jgi:hypothetical protein